VLIVLNGEFIWTGVAASVYTKKFASTKDAILIVLPNLILTVLTLTVALSIRYKATQHTPNSKPIVIVINQFNKKQRGQ
jgi:hypothetical protein